MISQCMNPTCGRELHYLRSGRVIRVVRKTGVEHFWLCGECNRNYDFCFLADGGVAVRLKHAEPPKRIESIRPAIVQTLVA